MPRTEAGRLPQSNAPGGIWNDDEPAIPLRGRAKDSFDDHVYAEKQCDKLGDVRDLVEEIRFVAVGNHVGSPLEAFAFSTFGKVAIHPVTNDDSRGFSSQLGTYSIIVALFDDVARVKRAFREIKPVADNKLCYGLMTESNPSARGALMRFAFDDVFDTRMKPAEIILRMKAQLSRQSHYNGVAKDSERFETFCEKNIIGRVHSTQVEILKQLYDNMGKVVRYRELASYDFHAGNFRLESLTVRIHYLRKKLVNYEIRVERGVGYSLVKIDN